MKRGRKSVRVAVAFVRWKQAHSVSKLIWINKLISISTHRVTRFQSISYCSCSWENILPKFSSYLQVEERRGKRIIERNQLDEPRETSPAFVISMNPLKTQKKRVSHMPSNDDTKAKQRWKKNCHNFYVMISRSKISDNFFVTNLIFFFSVFKFIHSRRTVNQFVNYIRMWMPTGFCRVTLFKCSREHSQCISSSKLRKGKLAIFNRRTDDMKATVEGSGI